MKNCVLLFIKLYRVFLSPFQILLPGPFGCRFYPSCSEYTFQTVKKYGIRKGTRQGVARLLRCNPWSEGGYDPAENIWK